jgi:hypothetical protein
MEKKELFLAICWIDGNPVIDGANYHENKDTLLDYINSLPKIQGIEYTICSINHISNIM